MKTRTLLVLPVALAALIGAAGCTKTVDKAELEGQVSSSLKQRVGQEPKDVTCPDDLKAEVGESSRCTLEAADGIKYGVTVQVTRVEGSDVRFNVKVDDEPKS